MRSCLLALATFTALLAGCGSACQDLADRICDCQTVGTERDSCKTSVKAQINAVSPTEADQKLCEATLKTCPDPTNNAAACDALRTPAGKAACGLSY